MGGPGSGPLRSGSGPGPNPVRDRFGPKMDPAGLHDVVEAFFYGFVKTRFFSRFFSFGPFQNGSVLGKKLVSFFTKKKVKNDTP